MNTKVNGWALLQAAFILNVFIVSFLFIPQAHAAFLATPNRNTSLPLEEVLFLKSIYGNSGGILENDDSSLGELFLLNELFVETETRPVGNVIVVQRGDTLSKIARDFLGDASRFRELAAINNISNPNLIFPGQRIVLSGAAIPDTDPDLRELVPIEDIFSDYEETSDDYFARERLMLESLFR